GKGPAPERPRAGHPGSLYRRADGGADHRPAGGGVWERVPVPDRRRRAGVPPGHGGARAPARHPDRRRMSAAERPYTLIAELHYACPLRCAYCSNPLDYAPPRAPEALLPTEQWLRVFEEAEALGIVQVHLTGGEPLLRQDLDRLVAGARALGLYVSLITGGVPLDRRQLHRLRDCGLEAVQLS